MKKLYEAGAFCDIFALPLSFNFDDGQVRRNEDGNYEEREHDRAIELQMIDIKEKLKRKLAAKFSKRVEGGMAVKNKYDLEQKLRVGYSNKTLFGGLMTLMMIFGLVGYLVFRLNTIYRTREYDYR